MNDRTHMTRRRRFAVCTQVGCRTLTRHATGFCERHRAPQPQGEWAIAKEVRDEVREGDDLDGGRASDTTTD